MNLTSIPFQTFTEGLRQRLEKPLPGEVAHSRMAAGSRYKLGIVPNERTRRSAVLILFYPYHGEIYVPLILRPAYEGVHGGQMAFPGGRYERTDESLVRTALREAQEEIGIRLTDVKVLGQLTELFIPPSNFWVQPVVGVMNHKPDFYPDPHEVDSVFEVSLSELTDATIVGTQQLEVRGHLVDAPFYQLQERRVWGATAMMIAELVVVLEEAF
jgi:8-oxo-dGTP pyrophosphatase MutT (NUDIX family)